MDGDLLESAEAQKIILCVWASAAHAYAMQAEEEEGSWNDREKRVGSSEDPLGVQLRLSGLPARTWSIVWSAHDDDSDVAELRQIENSDSVGPLSLQVILHEYDSNSALRGGDYRSNVTFE